MSLRDFNRGLTAEQVRAKKEAGIVERDEALERRNREESEHRLNIVRSIQVWNQWLDKEIEQRCKGIR